MCASARVTKIGGGASLPRMVHVDVDVMVGMDTFGRLTANTGVPASACGVGRNGVGLVGGADLEAGVGLVVGVQRFLGRDGDGDIKNIAFRRWSASDLCTEVPGRGSLAGFRMSGSADGFGGFAGRGFLSPELSSEIVPKSASISA